MARRPTKLARTYIDRDPKYNYIEHFEQKNVEEQVCGVCAGYTPLSKLTCLNDIPSSELFRFNLDFIEHKEIRTAIQLDMEHTNHPHLDGLLLDEKGLCDDGTVRVCHTCLSSLNNSEIPPLALANFMWVGKVPEELTGLTRIEEKLLGIYRSCNYIIRLHYKTSETAKCQQQKALVGNIITFPQNMANTIRTLQKFPMPLHELKDHVKVHLVGVTLPKKKELKRLLTVRRDKVIKAAEWLIKHNCLYKGLKIDPNTYKDLPKNNIPPELYATMMHDKEIADSFSEGTTYTNMKGRYEEDLSEASNSDYDSESDCDGDEEEYVDTEVPLNSSGVVDTDGTTISSNDMQQSAFTNMKKNM
eukprot:Lithocolla_globosa_v1_NODE_638_length_3534_cov_135.240299.p1 type:complete len:359 gc:universal NODE_638_length_3534_cov_135.240299:1778-702(-)